MAPATPSVSRDQIEQTALDLITRTHRGYIRGVAERDGAVVAVAVDTTDAYRHVAIFCETDMLWSPPAIITGTPISAERATVTTAQIPDLFYTSIRAPQPGQYSPEHFWLAICGTAACDATAIELSTTSDNRTVGIGPDGFFLALVQAVWGERVHIVIHTADNHRIRIHH